jgi:hypothetical protein
MNNLLGKFQEEWNDEELESSDEEDKDGDIEMDKQQQPTNQPNYMENFFREVDSIKVDVDAVLEASKSIAVIHEQALSATTNDEEQALSRELRPVIENTNKRAQRTKTLLKLLKEETDNIKEEKTLNASDIRCVCVCGLHWFWVWLDAPFLIDIFICSLSLFLLVHSLAYMQKYILHTSIHQDPRELDHYHYSQVCGCYEDISAGTTTVQE